MNTVTTIRSWAAICLGLFFAGVTGYVLFQDVIHGAPITAGHVTTLAAVVAAFAAGQFVWPALRTGAILPGLMLAVLCLGATGYIVVSSGSRTAEQASNKAAAITAANAARERESGLLIKAEAMLAEAQKQLAKECQSGAGARCRGVRATVEVYEAAIRGHHATLAALPPPKVASGYAHTARVLSSWGITVTDEWLSLNMPFVIVLITEFGTIGFLHLGFGHAHRARPVRVVPAPSNDIEPPPGKSDPVIDWVRAFEKRHGRKPQIPELQRQFKLPKTTAWRRIKAA